MKLERCGPTKVDLNCLHDEVTAACTTAVDLKEVAIEPEHIEESDVDETLDVWPVM